MSRGRAEPELVHELPDASRASAERNAEKAGEGEWRRGAVWGLPHAEDQKRWKSHNELARHHRFAS